MNMQVRVETFEEHLRHAGVIDALDDKRRVWLLEYAVSCREKLKIENSNIEKKLIKENLGRKRGKEKR